MVGEKQTGSLDHNLRTVFCVITHWVTAISYWCFRTTYQSHLHGDGITATCCVITQNSEVLIYFMAEVWNHKWITTYSSVLWELQISKRTTFNLSYNLILGVAKISYFKWNHMQLVTLILVFPLSVCSWDCTVNTVTGYELDNQGIVARLPAEARNFSLFQCVQTGSGTHTPFYLTGITGFMP
jgi:hypothetical protein